MKLFVELASEEDSKIHKPILQITYWEQTRNTIESTTTKPCEYLVDYYQTIKFEVVFWILVVIVVLLMLPFLGCKFYSFSSRNPRALMEDSVSFTNIWGFKIIYEVSDIISTGMSLALFIVACYVFSFYKVAG